MSRKRRRSTGPSLTMDRCSGAKSTQVVRPMSSPMRVSFAPSTRTLRPSSRGKSTRMSWVVAVRSLRTSMRAKGAS